MTSQPLSQCGTCARFRSALGEPGTTPTPDARPTCAAFPSGIPRQVFGNQVDHRQPVEGDGGIRWQSNGEPFPAWAFRPGVIKTEPRQDGDADARRRLMMDYPVEVIRPGS